MPPALRPLAQLGWCCFFLAAVVAASCSSDGIRADPGRVPAAGADAGGPAGGQASGVGGVSGAGAAASAGALAGGAGGGAGAGSEGQPGGRGAEGGGAGAGGAAGQKALPTECPTQVPGAKMVRIERADGRAACIDEREVTQAEYHAFATSMTVDEYRALGFCGPSKDDTENEPSYLWPEPNVGNDHQNVYGTCKYGLYQPDKTPNAAVGCVYSCQARAYCAWAGKELCGRFDGEEPMNEETAVDPSVSVWAAACTNGGTTKRSHASEAPDACGGKWAVDAAITDATSPAHPECHGQGLYSSLYNLSGGLTEYVNAWTTATETTKSRPMALGTAPFTTPAADGCGRAFIAQPAWGGGFRCCQRLAAK